MPAARLTVARTDEYAPTGALAAFFAKLPSVSRVELFVYPELDEPLLDVFFEDGEDKPWSVQEFGVGTHTRNMIESLMATPATAWGIL